ncbi:MAG TPA: hypothetical protein P5060_01035 [Candidatus Absconditabacterales bacterium]|nr:hypothetical protein [Candidatus Absconditabacterales bacterium]
MKKIVIVFLSIVIGSLFLGSVFAYDLSSKDNRMVNTLETSLENIFRTKPDSYRQKIVGALDTISNMPSADDRIKAICLDLSTRLINNMNVNVYGNNNIVNNVNNQNSNNTSVVNNYYVIDNSSDSYNVNSNNTNVNSNNTSVNNNSNNIIVDNDSDDNDEQDIDDNDSDYQDNGEEGSGDDEEQDEENNNNSNNNMDNDEENDEEFPYPNSILEFYGLDNHLANGEEIRIATLNVVIDGPYSDLFYLSDIDLDINEYNLSLSELKLRKVGGVNSASIGNLGILGEDLELEPGSIEQFEILADVEVDYTSNNQVAQITLIDLLIEDGLGNEIPVLNLGNQVITVGNN